MAEAIANGAVVVYVGDPLQLGELADSVVAVDTPYQLSLVLRQFRFDWHREQVWLRAFRRLHRQSRFERLATWLHGLSLTDAPTRPAAPKATMITISKRPHLLGLLSREVLPPDLWRCGAGAGSQHRCR